MYEIGERLVGRVATLQVAQCCGGQIIDVVLAIVQPFVGECLHHAHSATFHSLGLGVFLRKNFKGFLGVVEVEFLVGSHDVSLITIGQESDDVVVESYHLLLLVRLDVELVHVFGNSLGVVSAGEEVVQLLLL